MKTAVITGGSSGIGKSTVSLFIKNGYKVYEMSRSGSSFEGVEHISCDVADENSVNAAFENIAQKENSIDVLVNNAGMGIASTIEFTSEESARRIFDVNFFGQFHCIKAALGLLRKSDDPRIICVSSVAGVLSIPYQAFYSATKAAVNSMAMALSNELKHFNIKVSIVMPGDVSTGFTDTREIFNEGTEFYGSLPQDALKVMEKDERNGMSPDKIASLIYKLSQKKSPKILYTGGFKYKVFVFIAKILPTNLTNVLVGKMYS